MLNLAPLRRQCCSLALYPAANERVLVLFTALLKKGRLISHPAPEAGESGRQAEGTLVPWVVLTTMR
jgi:hypothetical protein